MNKHELFNMDWDSTKFTNNLQGLQDNHVKPEIWSNVVGQSDEALSKYTCFFDEIQSKRCESKEIANRTESSNLDTNNCVMDPSKLKLSSSDLQLKPFNFKAPKVHTKNSQKDDIYWKKREKNNAASRKSRISRRMKHTNITLRVIYLENENIELKTKISGLKSRIKELKEKLKTLEHSSDFDLDNIDQFMHKLESMLEYQS